MDQQLETLNLEDGSISLDFDGGEQEVITSECSFTSHEDVGMDQEIELGQVSEDIAMDTDSEVVENVQFLDSQETENIEKAVLSDAVVTESQRNIQMSVEVSTIQSPTIETKKIVTSSTVKPTRISSAINQSYRAGGSTVKPVSIAPKPITMASSGFVNVRKYSIASVQPRSIGDLGGRQVVVVPTTSSHRFKMVGTPLRAPGPVQIQVRQRMVPPLTKLTIPGGKDVSSGIVTVQKAASTRFISIPSQQMGLLGGKITQLVAVSPTKQNVSSTSTILPIRQNFSTIKSPTKILPAPQGVSGGNKVILTASPQSIIVRPPANKPGQGQVMKVDGSTILASIPAGQKINPQQIHQINIPGKGIQYVRLVPAPGLSASSATSSTVQSQPQVSVVAAPSQSQPLTTTTASAVKKPIQPQILPKTFLFTEFKNNIVQMVPGKGKSIINSSSIGPGNIKKVITKSTKPVPGSAVESQQNIKIMTSVDKQEVVKGIKSESILVTDEESHKDNAPVTTNNGIREKKEVNLQSETQQEIILQKESNEGQDAEHLEDMDDHIGESATQDDSLSVNDPLNVVMMPDSYIQMQENIHQNFQKSREMDVKEELSEYTSKSDSGMAAMEFGMRPRKPCNCTKSQCLKLYCDCFANGEFCNQCNCNNCFNNLSNEEYRQKAIRSCLERNPNAFRPKIGKAKNNVGLDVVRRHNKGCNCKRSGCLKNYCECYEGKIACSANCKCVGCRNVEDAIDKRILRRSKVECVIGLNNDSFTNSSHLGLSSNGSGNSKFHKLDSSPTTIKNPCNIMTNDVIEAVCQCLIAQAADAESTGLNTPGGGGARKVLEEFAHCLKDIISVAQQHKTTSIV